MKLRFLGMLLMTGLAACANNTNGSAAAGSGPGSSALGVVETPLFVAFKIPTCLGGIPILLPGAFASEIVPFKDSPAGSGSRYFMNEVRDACGPPYVATPK